jgi:hypothetical protein
MKLFADLGERKIPDIPVGEWVDFIHGHLTGAASDLVRAAEDSR